MELGFQSITDLKGTPRRDAMIASWWSAKQVLGRRRREPTLDDCISEKCGAKSLSFWREEPRQRKAGRRKLYVFATRVWFLHI